MARFNIIGNSGTTDATQYVSITRRIIPLQTNIRISSSAPAPVTVKCSDEDEGEVSYTATINPGETKSITGRGLFLISATIPGSGILYSGKPKYNGLFGKPSYLEFAEIASPKPINFEIGNYVDYSRTGIRYKLYRLPLVEKSARKNTAGDAFVYKNVQFFAPTKDLELALFRDLVLNDNLIHFSNIPNVDTYEDVAGIARRIQANMDDFAGEDVWSIEVFESEDEEYNAIISEVKQFSLSDGTCLDALNKIYELWKGIGWVYSESGGLHTITIGRPNIQDGDNTTTAFEYGYENGLKVISKADSSKADLATRVYAYGSDRNLPARYYNKLDPAIKDAESVYLPYLMLPLSDWGTTRGEKDARLAYLQSDSAITDKLGIIPKILRFDGTGDLEEIYPSIEGMTIGEVVNDRFPSTGYTTSERVDELKDVVNPEDDGVYTEDGTRVIQSYDLEVQPWDITNSVIPGQILQQISLFPVCTFEGTPQGGKVVIKSDGMGRFYLSETTQSIKEYIKFGTKPDISATVRVDGVPVRHISLDLTENYDEEEGYFYYGFNLDTISFRLEESASNIEVVIYIRAEYDKKSEEEVETVVKFAITEASATLQYAIGSTFQVTLKQIGFDMKEMGSTLSNGFATLSMKTGKCAGREFLIKDLYYDEDENEWILTCQRQEDSSVSMWFPNSIYSLAAGDRFVLLDMEMPLVYVEAAMTRLHNAAEMALARLENPKKVYTPIVDSKAIMLSEIALIEGMYMRVEDDDLIGESSAEFVLIDSMQIAENDDAIPIYSVTLRDEKQESMFQKLTNELTRGNDFIHTITEDDKRNPAPDPDENNGVNPAPRVIITANKDYLLDGEDGITLTAETEGIANPQYQWQYLNSSQQWVDILNETYQGYFVDADSQIHFPSGDMVADVRVAVHDGDDTTNYYYATILISKVGKGLTILLSSPAILIEATDTHAVAGTYTTDVLAYSNGTRLYPTISSIEGTYTGMTTQKVEVSTRTYVRIIVTTALTTPSGSLTINAVVNGTTYPLVCSWALALKGGDGQDGQDGDDGYSNATIYLYQRFPTGTPSGTRVGSTTYTFATDTLAGTLNGWSRTVPSGDGPVYVTFARVSSSQASVSIPAGWVSDSPAGGWSLPARMTGQDGQVGKIMRGVNRWTSTFEPEGGWQGMNDEDGLFYDVVVYSVYDSVQEKYVDKYFYLTDGAYGNTTPGSAAAEGYWIEAVNYDFIATKVLLADNAFIDVLSGNAIYMYDNDGSAGGQKVAGIQGGSIDPYGNPVINFFAGTDASTVIADAPFRVYSDGTMVATKGTFGSMEIGVDSAFGNALIGTEVFGQSGRAGDLETLISPRGFRAYNTGGDDYDACTIAISPYPSAMGDANGVMAITTEGVEVFNVMRNGDVNCQNLDCQDIDCNDITANTVTSQEYYRPLTSSVNERMVGSTSVTHIWIGSYSDYNVLTKSNDTMYIVNSGTTAVRGIYIGSAKVASL